MKISIKLRDFSDRLFERSHGEGGVGSTGGMEREVGGVDNSGVGATVCWGGGVGGNSGGGGLNCEGVFNL